MANMGYCRWENTAGDLSDCLEHMEEELSESEQRAKDWILFMARELLEGEGYYVEKYD